MTLMNNNIKVLAVIPARGGSKGIPRKNIKLLEGHPLIAYTITPALNSSFITDLIVSTEDREIAEISEKYGTRVPFLRPFELATDKALAIPTIQHAVLEAEKLYNKVYEYVLMLQPTCPFTTVNDIDKSIQKLIDSNADSVISVKDAGAYHPARMKIVSDEKLLLDYDKEEIEMLSRQNLPVVYIRSGDIYACKRNILMEKNSFKGNISRPYIITGERTINIDTSIDWLLAESIMKQFGNPLKEHNFG